MHQTINGWTKAQMLERIEKFLPPDGTRCMQSVVFDGQTSMECIYFNGQYRCAAGAMLPDDHEAITNPKAFFFSSIAGSRFVGFPWPLNLTGMAELQCTHDGSNGNAKQACLNWINANVVDA